MGPGETRPAGPSSGGVKSATSPIPTLFPWNVVSAIPRTASKELLFLKAPVYSCFVFPILPLAWRNCCPHYVVEGVCITPVYSYVLYLLCMVYLVPFVPFLKWLTRSYIISPQAFHDKVVMNIVKRHWWCCCNAL